MASELPRRSQNSPLDLIRDLVSTKPPNTPRCTSGPSAGWQPARPSGAQFGRCASHSMQTSCVRVFACKHSKMTVRYQARKRMHQEGEQKDVSFPVPNRRQKLARAAGATSFYSDSAATMHSCHWQLICLQAPPLPRPRRRRPTDALTFPSPHGRWLRHRPTALRHVPLPMCWRNPRRRATLPGRLSHGQ